MASYVQAAATLILALLAAQDICVRRLANGAVLALATLYFADAALIRDSSASVASHAAIAAVMLALFGALRHLGWIGGGDVKLAAAIFLWAGPALVFPVMLIVGAGGLLLGFAIAAAVAWRRGATASRCISARGVPYGVALALGGAFAIWAPVANSASIN
ncbi:peptidase A24 [Burkholderia sp. MSMB617WGS]|uniref:prepilin peptidase n=1 Tax=Burkholderia TaxID=32008 RepID=UPI00053145BA|nr:MULTISPECIES: prepilin peptidase [Burkholderia]AOJ82177.1 peptidase A24 [Burkholderia savannae]AOK48323.1 peptidase A24 [Burkholderia sp. MSMB617WGS]KGS03081.1 type IV leader peptidase family protein [Burkholderia sp. ABCPW 111]KWZ40490.1 peptidase A24 [Burkholderia savannae]